MVGSKIDCRFFQFGEQLVQNWLGEAFSSSRASEKQREAYQDSEDTLKRMKEMEQVLEIRNEMSWMR